MVPIRVKGHDLCLSGVDWLMKEVMMPHVCLIKHKTKQISGCWRSKGRGMQYKTLEIQTAYYY